MMSTHLGLGLFGGLATGSGTRVFFGDSSLLLLESPSCFCSSLPLPSSNSISSSPEFLVSTSVVEKSVDFRADGLRFRPRRKYNEAAGDDLRLLELRKMCLSKAGRIGRQAVMMPMYSSANLRPELELPASRSRIKHTTKALRAGNSRIYQRCG